MKLKRTTSALLCSLLLLSSLSACASDPDPDITGAVTPFVGKKAITMQYDDVLDLAALYPDGVEVEIGEQQVTSRLTGSQSPDAAVLTYDSQTGRLTAVGTGTATVKLGRKTYTATVIPAPISLFMITGHSIGAGQEGHNSESVICPDGKTYSIHGTAEIPKHISGIGIGASAASKPQWIDAFSESGYGSPGESSALAWQWHNLTGEKVWILNTAVGGSCIPSWIRGSANYAQSVLAFRYAQAILTEEIAAGHYTLKDMAIVYHSAANFAHTKTAYTNEDGQRWYDSLWNGYKSDLAADMNGDGQPETVRALSLVPIWCDSNSGLVHDKPANYFMASSAAYEDIFMGSVIGRSWLNASTLSETFPLHEYQTQSGKLTLPVDSKTKTVFADGVHYIQSAYNALGIDIADNLYRFLRTENAPTSVELVAQLTTLSGVPYTKAITESLPLSVGKSVELIPFVQPVSASGLTFALSDNLELSYPCIVTARAPGVGTLTVSYADQVLATVTFHIAS